MGKPSSFANFISPTALLSGLFLYSCVTAGADHIHDLIHQLGAQRLGGSFHHNTQHRLCAGFPHQDATGVAQLRRHLVNNSLHRLVVVAKRID